MSTPVKLTPVRGSEIADSPGTWRHPRLDEITRRREKTNFSEKNVRRIAYNVVALLSMWTVQLVATFRIDGQIFPKFFRVYFGWIWFTLQLLPFIQIGLACLPLLRPKDDLPDIPLTATQRQLLGLDPSVIPPTPDAQISTPPRYSRTPSLAGSVGSRASLNGSPISNRGSPIPTGSQYSPLGSPVFQRTMSGGGGGLANRRSSFSSSTNPFAASTASSLFSDPASPSPSGGKRTSVGLNNKWLNKNIPVELMELGTMTPEQDPCVESEGRGYVPAPG
ncbi:Nuclear pore protein POM34 [Cladobotryum mycophilum]|uniref:Nuclear pore protein POM34 n=1 Tax=Cladobotryum mycophilum TaxID=491253 RepID=A0ABR0SMM8_9HYPO